MERDPAVAVAEAPALTPDAKTVTVRGTATNVLKGTTSSCCAARASNRVVKRVLGVPVDTVAQTTRIDLTEDPLAPLPLIFLLLATARLESHAREADDADRRRQRPERLVETGRPEGLRDGAELAAPKLSSNLWPSRSPC